MKSITVFLVVASLLVFSSVSFAEEQGKVKIENGMISFPEEDTPGVNTKDLRFSFAPDAPEAIKAIQGKIFGSGADKKGQAIYLIPLEYDSATKAIKLLYVTNNKGTQYKPTKMTIAGVYNGLEGNSVKSIDDKSDKPWAHFYTVPVEKGVNLRLLWASSGSVTNLRPIAEFPADMKSPLTLQMTNTVATSAPNNGIILQHSNSWIVGKWTGFQQWSKSICKFEAVEKNGKLYTSFMWVDEKDKLKKMYSVPVDFDGDTLTFLSFSKDKFVLKRTTDSRMDGNYITKTEGKEVGIRFWKEGEAKSSPFLGNWEDRWSGNMWGLEVLYVDDSAMTALYRFIYEDPSSGKPKGGTNFINFTNTESERKYIFFNPNTKHNIIFLFAQDNKKVLMELKNDIGRNLNSATFIRK